VNEIVVADYSKCPFRKRGESVDAIAYSGRSSQNNSFSKQTYR